MKPRLFKRQDNAARKAPQHLHMQPACDCPSTVKQKYVTKHHHVIMLKCIFGSAAAKARAKAEVPKARLFYAEEETNLKLEASAAQ